MGLRYSTCEVNGIYVDHPKISIQTRMNCAPLVVGLFLHFYES